MSTLRRYLSLLFVQRWLVTTFAMLILVSLLDALGNADLLPEGAGFADRLRFMALRAPMIFDRIFLFALMLGVLLTYLSLIRRDELVALVASGISAFGQVRALAPVVVLATLVSALLIDQTLPRSVRALDSWLGADALDEAETPDHLWLDDEGTLVEITGLQGETLTDLTFYRRGADGQVDTVIKADTARHGPGGWTLSGVQLVLGEADEPLPQVWETPQTPATLQKLNSPPRDLSLADLLALAEMRGSGSQPSSAYEVWALHRLTLPLAALAFVLVAVALMQRLGRRDTGDLAMIAGLAAGFAFLIVDGVFKTLAEAGGVGAGIAAGVPLGGLLLLGVHLILERERLA